MSEPIGQLNGKWSILFRAMLSVMVFAIPYSITLHVYQVKSVIELKISQAQIGSRIDQFMAPGPRYTKVNAETDNLQLRREMLEFIENRYPPKWLIEKIAELERRLGRMEDKPK